MGGGQRPEEGGGGDGFARGPRGRRGRFAGGEGAACCWPVHHVEATAWTPKGRRPHVRRRDRGRSLQGSRRPGWSHRPAHGSGGAADPGLQARAPGPVRAGQAWSWAQGSVQSLLGRATSVGAPSRAPGRSPGQTAFPASTPPPAQAALRGSCAAPTGRPQSPRTPSALARAPGQPPLVPAAPLRTQVPGLSPQPLRREAVACSSQPWSLAGSCRETSSTLCTDTGRRGSRPGRSFLCPAVRLRGPCTPGEEWGTSPAFALKPLERL